MKTLLFLYGSHYFLNAYPFFVYVLIWLAMFALLYLLRFIFEGKGYNVAYSASLGDVALTGFILVAASIIRHPGFHPADWMESKAFHLIIAGVAILSAVVSYFWIFKPKYVADKWHSLMIVPVFVYCIFTVIPIYWAYASVPQFLLGVVLLLFWIALVKYDAHKGRLDQRTWIAKNRPDWKFKD